MKQSPIETYKDNPGDPLLRNKWVGDFTNMVDFINNEYPMIEQTDGSLEIYAEDGTVHKLSLNDWLSKGDAL